MGTPRVAIQRCEKPMVFLREEVDGRWEQTAAGITETCYERHGLRMKVWNMFLFFFKWVIFRWIMFVPFQIEQIRTCLFPFNWVWFSGKPCLVFRGVFAPAEGWSTCSWHHCIWSDRDSLCAHICTCNKDKQGIIYTLDWMHNITITVHVICVYYYTHLHPTQRERHLVHPMPFFVSGYNDNQCICSKDVPAAANAFGTRSHQI